VDEQHHGTLPASSISNLVAMNVHCFERHHALLFANPLA